MAQYERPYTPPTATVQHVGLDGLSASASSNASKQPFKGKGMQLGAAKSAKANDLLDALGGSTTNDLAGYTSPFAQAAPAAAVPEQRVESAESPAAVSAHVGLKENPFGHVEQEVVHLVVREKLSLELSKEGGLNSLELKGDLDLTISEASSSKILIQLTSIDSFGNDLQFKTHPNVDKNGWAKEKKLGLRDATKRGFPVGQGLKVLRWRLATKDESIVPLNITCWPSTAEGSMEVNMEYEMDSKTITELRNVLISIPLPPGSYPSITNANGTYSINPETHSLDWAIESISAENDNLSGTLEFTIDGDDTNAFFPIAVDFAAKESMVGVLVSTVETAEGKEKVDYSVDSLLQTEDYLVA